MKRVSSRDNPTFKLLLALAGSSRERRKLGRTLLDGMHLVSSYAQRFGPPELVVVSEHGLEQDEIAAFLRVYAQADALVLNDGLFKEISPVTTPTGIIAVITVPKAAGEPDRDASWVLLDAIQDSGNLGSILRSAAAAGISDVFLGAGCAHAWSPRVLRAAMGAHFTLRLHEHAALGQVLERFGGTSVSTTVHGGKPIYEVDLTARVAWLFGNEGAGLSAGLEESAHQSAFIPMPGATESLNVAAAAAVCLFEEVRQKAAEGR